MGYAEKNIRKKTRGSETGELTSIVRSSFIGFGIAALAAVVLWILATVIAYSNEDPDSVVGALSLAAIYIASFISGFLAVKLNKKSALACGALSGALLTLLFWFISFFFDEAYSSGYSFILSLGIRLAMILMSVFGAFAGLHRRSSRRKRR